MQELENKKEAIILNLFLTEKENSVKSISEKSGLLEKTVHRVINKYLKARVING